MAEGYEMLVVRKAVRRMYIRIRRDRTVVLTVPERTPDAVWQAFADTKKEWIEAALSEIPAPPAFSYTEGERHYLLGRPLTLRLREGRKNGCVIEGDMLWLTVRSREDSQKEKYIEDFWRRELSLLLTALIEKWAPRLGKAPSGFSIRRMRSRWGSCRTGSGELTFSLELAAKPVVCIELVVVHELAHLIERRHSPRFRAVMSRWLPDWKERQKALCRFPREFN